jgi:hypothetical protein
VSASEPVRSYLPPEEPDHRESGLAAVSLLLGILSWIAFPVVCALPAVFLGHKARIDIAKSEGKLTGDMMAAVGLGLGYANIALAALIGLCVAGVLLFAAFGNALPD